MRTRQVFRAGFFTDEGPDSFSGLINCFLEWLRVRGHTEQGINAKKMPLGSFMFWCRDRGIIHPREITLPILERFQRHLFYQRKKNGAPLALTTQLSRLSPIRSFFKWLAKKRYIPYNPAAEMDLPKKGFQIPKAVLSVKEAAMVLNQPDTGLALGIRDRAILETFYSTGMRRMELATLKIFDLNRDDGVLTIRQGKGKKDRVVPVGLRAITWIEKYLYQVRSELAAGEDEGVLFLTAYGVPYSPDGLTSLVANYVKEAEIGKKGSCHLFRHTCATLMLENGADIRYVQELLGHSKLETTQIYTRVSIKKLKAVHSRTHPAERKRKKIKPSQENP